MATVLSSSEQIRLHAALQKVSAAAGLNPDNAQLLRYTMNAVYRVPFGRAETRQEPAGNVTVSDDGVVVRMTTGPQAIEQTTRVARIAAEMSQRGLPTVRLWPGVKQPVRAGDWSATIWTLLPQESDRRFVPADLAGPLLVLHGHSPAGLDLPPWDTIGKVERRLAGIDTTDGPRAAFLRQWAASDVGLPLPELLDLLAARAQTLNEAVRAAEWTLPWGLIHGDAHAGNLLEDRSGRTFIDGPRTGDRPRVVLCDLDSVAYGPPEWDLVPAAHGALRFGDDPALHHALAGAYGLDVTACPAWGTLREIRELQLVTSVIADLPGRPDVAKELAHRLTTLLANNRKARWNRYR